MANLLTTYLASGASSAATVAACYQNLDNLAAPCEVLIVGPLPAAAPATTVANKTYLVRNSREAVTLFGTKSAMISALTAAFCVCSNQNVKINVLPVAVSGGTQAVYDLTIAGAAAANHTKTVRVEGYEVNVFIPAGASVAAQATLYKAAFDAIQSFPFTTATTATGVTFTAVDPGTQHNDLVLVQKDTRSPAAITDNALTLAQTTAGAGVLDLSGLAAATGSCCYPCVVSLDNDVATIAALQAWSDEKSGCFASGCFQSIYWSRKTDVDTAEVFGQGAPGVSDPYNLKNVGLWLSPSAEFSPYQIATFRGVHSCCSACSNPADPVQNEASTSDCFPCEFACQTALSQADYDRLWNAGWTPVTCIDGKLGVEKERFFYRFNDDGVPTIGYGDPTQHRILNLFSSLFGDWHRSNYGSSYMVANGTTIPQPPTVNGRPLPDALVNRRATTPDLYRGHFVQFLETLQGTLLDQQDFAKAVYSYTDDQLREMCQGDPKLLALFISKLRIARPLQRVRLVANITTRFC